jgi:hypothetical protein
MSSCVLFRASWFCIHTTAISQALHIGSLLIPPFDSQLHHPLRSEFQRCVCIAYNKGRNELQWHHNMRQDAQMVTVIMSTWQAMSQQHQTVWQAIEIVYSPHLTPWVPSKVHRPTWEQIFAGCVCQITQYQVESPQNFKSNWPNQQPEKQIHSLEYTNLS